MNKTSRDFSSRNHPGTQQKTREMGIRESGIRLTNKKNLRRQNYYESCGGIPHHKKPQVISPTSSHITNLKSYHQPQVISPTAIAVHWRQNSLGFYICDLIQNLPADLKSFLSPKAPFKLKNLPKENVLQNHLVTTSKPPGHCKPSCPFSHARHLF